MQRPPVTAIRSPTVYNSLVERRAPAATYAMWDRANLARFLRQQSLYLGVGFLIWAFFWAIGEHINPATAFLYSFCFGNLITPPLARIRCRYSQRPFPFNWIIFLLTLLLLTPIVYTLSSVVVWWLAPPTPQPLVHLLRTGWKLPFLVIIIFATLTAIFNQTRERLERKNLELQYSVDLTAAQLRLQNREMQHAREIQESLLPKNIPQLPGFEVATAWYPARVVGGDYFDVLSLGENRLAICVADVVGKGVSAALLMANVQAAVRAFAHESDSPASICTRVNTVLCENIAMGKFVTFFYGVLDASQHTLRYCSAGHPPPILASANSAQQLSIGGAILGVFPSWHYEDATIRLHPGDRLLLFTDGITEAASPDGEEFGEAKLAALAKAHSSLSASQLNATVLAQVSHFCGGHFQDDATLVVIAVN